MAAVQLRCQAADLLAAAAGGLPAVVVRRGHRGEPGVLHHVTNKMVLSSLLQAVSLLLLPSALSSARASI
jgi:phosphoglycolate phosphatase-like HAD superfamily hydrolase